MARRVWIGEFRQGALQQTARTLTADGHQQTLGHTCHNCKGMNLVASHVERREDEGFRGAGDDDRLTTDGNAARITP